VILRAALVLALLLPATASAETHRFKLRVGPFPIGKYETEFLDQHVPTPKVKGFVTKMRARLVDGNGDRVLVNEAMLHHVFFRNLDRLRVKGNCPTQLPEVFYGTGEEDEALDLPEGYGYRLRGKDRWEMHGMLMSHRYRPGHVYVQYSGKVDTDPDLQNVRPLWVRANGCGQVSSYHVNGGGAKGAVDDRVYHWRVPLTGRIVAAGGHLHAGSINLELRDPACGDRVLYDNRPFFAPADDLFYTVYPRLHEVGPVQTSWFQSREGIPIAKGQRLDLHGLYERQYARPSVMAITHIYVAPGGPKPVGCPELPGDRRQQPMKRGLRPSAPYQHIPLYKLNRRHLPVELDEPEGPVTNMFAGGAIDMRAYRFQPTEKVVVKAGATVRWRWRDRALHNLTMASGPQALGGQLLGKGGRVTTQFTVPGRYQFFCYLHPMTMREQVDVVP
jgi:plastocyanin